MDEGDQGILGTLDTIALGIMGQTRSVHPTDSRGSPCDGRMFVQLVQDGRLGPEDPFVGSIHRMTGVV
ncbi:hypothetical protein NX059_012233 [Plenodomus lindquistii]|nr:hypothetical protein NX059_012233 [Plenodomus lindquistii]